MRINLTLAVNAFTTTLRGNKGGLSKKKKEQDTWKGHGKKGGHVPALNEDRKKGGENRPGERKGTQGGDAKRGRAAGEEKEGKMRLTKV